MKKNITKALITETTINLMKERDDLKGLNLREIARALNCAHTNIYNYFPAYSDLLWEAYVLLLETFSQALSYNLSHAMDFEKRLNCFFATFADFYIDNKGWFRLIWLECIEGKRPDSADKTLIKINIALNSHIADIWYGLYGKALEPDNIKRTLHNTHCYIIGEVSNYLLGRGLIDDETLLKAQIVREAVNIFKLLNKS